MSDELKIYQCMLPNEVIKPKKANPSRPTVEDIERLAEIKTGPWPFSVMDCGFLIEQLEKAWGIK